MKAPGILVIYSDKSELEKVSAFLTEIFTEKTICRLVLLIKYCCACLKL